MRLESKCFCSDVCDCNTSCCFGFKIPLTLGYVLACYWLLFNGFTFPVMSFLFWPRYYILYTSCFICLVCEGLVLLGLVNACLKIREFFQAVVYGMATIYLLTGFVLIFALNFDIKQNMTLLEKSVKKFFNISVPPNHSFGILQSIQILYFFYLFVSYTYCSVVLQLYDIKNRYSRR